jgi:hypothetical protein
VHKQFRHFYVAKDDARLNTLCLTPKPIVSFPRGQGVSLMRDKGCQPNSTTFRQTCATLEILQAFTRDNNTKGNADTERCICTIKEECLCRQEWTCPLR